MTKRTFSGPQLAGIRGMAADGFSSAKLANALNRGLAGPGNQSSDGSGLPGQRDLSSGKLQAALAPPPPPIPVDKK
jgi:hypothetical protein